MKTYPIYVARNSYRGSDPRKRAKAQRENEQATALEAYVNQLLLAQTEPIRVYLWGEIASGCGLDYETVARIGYSIDCGSGGFTAWRHDMTYEQAMNAHSTGGQPAT